MHRAKFLLDKQSLKHIYFAFVHSYITYANIACASTCKTKLGKLYNKQKHASRIMYNKDKYACKTSNEIIKCSKYIQN